MAYSTSDEDCYTEQLRNQNDSATTAELTVDGKTMESTISRSRADSTMDTFFERRKSDMIHELRSIQLGTRPVTGQNHRDNLHQFMKKHLVSPSENSGKENVPANVDEVEEHRPDSVVFEVQGIVERRPVSTVLQSAAFRRQLENVIRGSIVSATQNNNRETQRTRTRRNVASVFSTTSRAGAERECDRPRLERSSSSDSISSQDSFSSARSSVDQDLDEVDSEPEVPRASIEPRQRPSSNVPSRPVVGEPLRHQQPPSQADQERAFGRLTWDDINRVHRDELVDELSELVHSRLVSSTLEGEFRATLELLVQDNVIASGTNGPAVQEFVRSLPGRGIPRNDFSHLGIVTGAENENWDNVSITSVSAHSVPFTQTNSFLSREIQSLKNQLSEMKNMMKISVDLQMDIQRSIRQEVAAALAQSSGQGACATVPVPTPPVNDSHCLICLERHTDSVLYQCGHMCVCYICGKDLVSRNLNCPVCRAPIKDVIRAYRTNNE